MSKSWQVLTLPAIQQLDSKLAQAVAIGYAEITLVIEKGKLRWIRGPTPSEPVQLEGCMPDRDAKEFRGDTR